MIFKLTLLGISSLSKIGETLCDLAEEAIVFDAESHLQHFREILGYYSTEFDNWTTCLIADNVRVNKTISNLSLKPHVGCCCYLLNLEVNWMVREHKGLDNVIDSVHDTMRAVKMKLKYEAILRNITPYHLFYTTLLDGLGSISCYDVFLLLVMI